MRSTVLFILLVLNVSQLLGQSAQIPNFDRSIAGRFSNLALHCIAREYTNHISHTLQNSSDIASPAELHPAFYGCYDWHSSVHGHWLLVKLLKRFPDLPERDSIIVAIDRNLTKENIISETRYFNAPDRASFERPYGWAWLLMLAAELATWEEPIAERWYAALKPLELKLVENYYNYLPSLHYPLRRGVHANTAFGITLALDYAQKTGNLEFANFLKERARFYYGNNQNIPAEWEPEGDDFLSPSLVVADLMSRVFTGEEYRLWWNKFMPELPENLLFPAKVTAREDPTGVHLDGLNLSRAWCMFSISSALPYDDAMRIQLLETAHRHAVDALPNVISENYLGTHWLATFAVYMFFTAEANKS